MDFRQIEQFSAVLRTGSVTSAAKELYTTQPALSRSISALENDLGVKLFSRSGKRLQVTDAGLAALRYFEEMSESLDGIQSTLRSLKSGQTGKVHVGIAYAVLDPTWMSTIVRNYFLSHPRVSLCFFQMDHGELLERLSNRELDFGYSSYVTEAPHLAWLKLYEEEIGVLLSRSNPLCERSVLSIADLKDEPLIVINTSSDAKEMALRFFQTAGVRPRIATEVDIPSVAGELIASGYGFSFISRERHELLNRRNQGRSPMENTVFRPLEPPCNRRTCYLGYNARRRMSKAALSVLEAVLEQFGLSAAALGLEEGK